jgi:hypothetical protein
MCIFHKWTKWEQYQLDSYRMDKNGNNKHIHAIERRERKHCEKCNTERDRRVSYVL